MNEIPWALLWLEEIDGRGFDQPFFIMRHSYEPDQALLKASLLFPMMASVSRGHILPSLKDENGGSIIITEFVISAACNTWLSNRDRITAKDIWQGLSLWYARSRLPTPPMARCRSSGMGIICWWRNGMRPYFPNWLSTKQRIENLTASGPGLPNTSSSTNKVIERVRQV